MGDNLIPYVEFLGLPGSGKSYYSHKVADALRSEGYQVVEPSWNLDHTDGKYIRAIKKMVMSSLFCIGHHQQTERLKDVIKGYGLSNSERKRYSRNLLYKAYLMDTQNDKVLFFDEGIAQIAVSVAVDCGKPAQQIYKELLAALLLEQKCVLIRIECDIETSLRNMEQRKRHDSHVEKMKGLKSKMEYLNKYSIESESLSQFTSLTIPFSDKVTENVSSVVQQIQSCLQ